ncbi:MAG: hypothetical protein JWO84_55 [Parcubacteria group bacterium]|nr:hypothetical protein [Parcubacteria group bacterium]
MGLLLVLLLCGAAPPPPHVDNAEERAALADDRSPDPGSKEDAQGRTFDTLVLRICKDHVCVESYQSKPGREGEGGGVTLIRKGDDKLLVPSEYVPPPN